MIVTLAEADIRKPSTNIEGVNTVIVRDSFGNPVAFVMEMSEDDESSVICTTTKSDPDFDTLIERLGVNCRYTP